MATKTSTKPVSEADTLAQSIAALEVNIKEVDAAEMLRQTTPTLPTGTIVETKSDLYNVILQKLADADTRAEADRVWQELVRQRAEWRSELAALQQKQADEETRAGFEAAKTR